MADSVDPQELLAELRGLVDDELKVILNRVATGPTAVVQHNHGRVGGDLPMARSAL